MDLEAATLRGMNSYPRKSSVVVQYGTAGFRSRADHLDHVLYRMGLLAVLRSKAKQATIGIMITASHNPEEDNGVKLVDPLGEMLEQAWEAVATRLANVDDDQLYKTLSDIVAMEGIDLGKPACVYIGRDTRMSSPLLAKAALDGVVALSGAVQDYGVVTTPMLHYFVACRNTGGVYGEASEEGYFSKLAAAFRKLCSKRAPSGNYVPRISFDGANGVGAQKMMTFLPYLGESLNVTVYNAGTGILNHLCGADYVKVQQQAPQGMPQIANERCVSVDGDADRVIYYYIDEQERFHLLDGDRIATLVAGYLMELVKMSQLELTLGLVQTAYANGSSTDYITKHLKVPVACVPTGVKHLHHRALQYDIGVYFEANGHGTVTFSKNAMERIKNAQKDMNCRSEQQAAADTLATLMDVINQTVGDAISDMLLVETVLQARGWNIQEWEDTYCDLPNRQLKVTVQDRKVIETTDAERCCVAPPGLQDAIVNLVAGYNKGRAFVRPSGTEDIVRVYAEAESEASANQLAAQVAMLVHKMAGGVGDSPAVPAM